VCIIKRYLVSCLVRQQKNSTCSKGIQGYSTMKKLHLCWLTVLISVAGPWVLTVGYSSKGWIGTN
jgi:hypothetical protein